MVATEPIPKSAVVESTSPPAQRPETSAQKPTTESGITRVAELPPDATPEQRLRALAGQAQEDQPLENIFRGPRTGKELMEAAKGRPDVLAALYSISGSQEELIYPGMALGDKHNLTEMFATDSGNIAAEYDKMLAQPTLSQSLRDFTFPDSISGTRRMHGFNHNYASRYDYGLSYGEKVTEPYLASIREKHTDPRTGELSAEGQALMDRNELAIKDIAIELVLTDAHINGDQEVIDTLLADPYVRQKYKYLESLDDNNPLKKATQAAEENRSEYVKQADYARNGPANRLMRAAWTDLSQPINIDSLKMAYKEFTDFLKTITDKKEKFIIQGVVFAILAPRLPQVIPVFLGEDTLTIARRNQEAQLKKFTPASKTNAEQEK